MQCSQSREVSKSRSFGCRENGGARLKQLCCYKLSPRHPPASGGSPSVAQCACCPSCQLHCGRARARGHRPWGQAPPSDPAGRGGRERVGRRCERERVGRRCEPCWAGTPSQGLMPKLPTIIWSSRTWMSAEYVMNQTPWCVMLSWAGGCCAPCAGGGWMQGATGQVGMLNSCASGLCCCCFWSNG